MVIVSSLPTIDEEMQQEALRVLREEILVNGKSVELFEQEFARFIGAKYAVALASGTDALVIALRCLGITKQVITTPMSFVATAESIVLAGARPVFADIDPRMWNINPDEIEKQITRDTQAIMPVHLYGLPCHMDRIMEIAKRHDLHVVEDCAQAHGATWKKKTVGTFGEIGCYSFYSTKNMTVGGNGGMIVTDDETIVEQAKSLREHGGGNEARYVGYNARMNTINAAIGRVQLKHLREWNMKRRARAAQYAQMIPKWGVTGPVDDPGHVYHLYAISSDRRDALRSHLREKKIFCGIHYPIPLHQLDPYKPYATGRYPVAERHAQACLSLPMYASLSDDEFQLVCDEITKFFEVK